MDTRKRMQVQREQECDNSFTQNTPPVISWRERERESKLTSKLDVPEVRIFSHFHLTSKLNFKNTLEENY